MASREQVSRRTVLKSIGAGSGVASGLNTAVRPVAATGSQNKITILAEGDQPARTEWVSQRWHNQTRTARQVARSLVDQFNTNTDILSVGVETGDARIGELLIPRVLVTVRSEDSPVVEKIPEEINGINIRIEEGSRPTPTGCDPGDPKSDCYLKS